MIELTTAGLAFKVSLPAAAWVAAAVAGAVLAVLRPAGEG